jgi:hypothetical protein
MRQDKKLNKKQPNNNQQPKNSRDRNIRNQRTKEHLDYEQQRNTIAFNEKFTVDQQSQGQPMKSQTPNQKLSHDQRVDPHQPNKDQPPKLPPKEQRPKKPQKARDQQSNVHLQKEQATTSADSNLQKTDKIASATPVTQGQEGVKNDQQDTQQKKDKTITITKFNQPTKSDYLSSDEKIILNADYFILNPITTAARKFYGCEPKCQESLRSKIFFSRKNLFGQFNSNEKIAYFFSKTLPNVILANKNRDKVNHFDMSELRRWFKPKQGKNFDTEYLNFVYSNFKNLNFLDLSDIKSTILSEAFFMNTILAHYGPNLIEINLSRSSVNDATMKRIISRCPKLEAIDLTDTIVDGTWINEINNKSSNIKSLKLSLPDWPDSYENRKHVLTEAQHVHTANLLDRYHKLECLHISYLKNTSMNWQQVYRKLYENRGIKNILNALKFTKSKIKDLKLPLEKLNDYRFENLRNLTGLVKLDISHSYSDPRETLNYTVSRILNKCVNLKVLILNYSGYLNDEAFTMKKINCALEELHLINADVTLATFDAFYRSPTRDTLRSLNIRDIVFNSCHEVNLLIDTFNKLSNIQMNQDELFSRDNTMSILTNMFQHKERHFCLYGFDSDYKKVFSYLSKRKTSIYNNEIECANVRFMFSNMH